MNTQRATAIFKCLRAAEIATVIFCIILEIVEFEAFREFFYMNEWAYFNAQLNILTMNKKKYIYFNGIKIFSYIILLLTLVDCGFYVFRRRGFTGPFKRDISINAFFTILWTASSIANSYPAFKYGYDCNDPDNDSRECYSKVLIITFNWINSILFFCTTLIALKLWRERKERYEGERRVEALGEVVYKYKPRPNTIAQVDEPEQVMIFKTLKKKPAPTYFIKTSPFSEK